MPFSDHIVDTHQGTHANIAKPQKRKVCHPTSEKGESTEEFHITGSWGLGTGLGQGMVINQDNHNEHT